MDPSICLTFSPLPNRSSQLAGNGWSIPPRTACRPFAWSWLCWPAWSWCCWRSAGAAGCPVVRVVFVVLDVGGMVPGGCLVVVQLTGAGGGGGRRRCWRWWWWVVAVGVGGWVLRHTWGQTTSTAFSASFHALNHVPTMCLTPRLSCLSALQFAGWCLTTLWSPGCNHRCCIQGRMADPFLHITCNATLTATSTAVQLMVFDQRHEALRRPPMMHHVV